MRRDIQDCRKHKVMPNRKLRYPRQNSQNRLESIRKLGEGRISNDLGFLYLCSSEGLVDGLHYHTWRHLSFIGLTNCECIVWQEKYKDMWIVLVNTDHII